MRIEETIDLAAAQTPEAIALCCGDRGWTYGALRLERDRRAGILIEAACASAIGSLPPSGSPTIT